MLTNNKIQQMEHRYLPNILGVFSLFYFFHTLFVVYANNEDLFASTSDIQILFEKEHQFSGIKPSQMALFSNKFVIAIPFLISLFV